MTNGIEKMDQNFKELLGGVQEILASRLDIATTSHQIMIIITDQDENKFLIPFLSARDARKIATELLFSANIVDRYAEEA